MGRRLALDTSVLIAAERSRIQPQVLLLPDDDLGIPMIVLAEFKGGIACADTQHQPRMRRFLDGFLELAQVLPYDDAVLEQHARLIAWTVHHGVARGQNDLIVAATAATGRTILTLDKHAHFDALPGVSAIVVDLPPR